MKPALKANLERSQDPTENLLNDLRNALDSVNPPIRVWLETQIQSALAQLPFLEASLKASLPQIKEVPSNRLLTPQEASKLLNIPVRWIYRHAKNLPHRRFGKYIRFPEKELIRWVESKQNRGI